jgi:hypothetical protein
MLIRRDLVLTGTMKRMRSKSRVEVNRLAKDYQRVWLGQFGDHMVPDHISPDVVERLWLQISLQRAA